MVKINKIVTDRELSAIMGNYMDSSVTKSNNPNTRVLLNRNQAGLPNYVQTRQFAYFGEVALSFNNYLFFNYTHRFEQSSTLPSKNRNYNYPGASLSLILSDMLPVLKKGKHLTIGNLELL